MNAPALATLDRPRLAHPRGPWPGPGHRHHRQRWHRPVRPSARIPPGWLAGRGALRRRCREGSRAWPATFDIPFVAGSAEELVAPRGRGHRGHRRAAVGPARDRGPCRIGWSPHAVPEAIRAGVRYRAPHGRHGRGRGRRPGGESADALGCGYRGQPGPRRAGCHRTTDRGPDRGLGIHGLASVALACGGTAARDHVPLHPLPRRDALGAW